MEYESMFGAWYTFRGCFAVSINKLFYTLMFQLDIYHQHVFICFIRFNNLNKVLSCFVLNLLKDCKNIHFIVFLRVIMSELRISLYQNNGIQGCSWGRTSFQQDRKITQLTCFFLTNLLDGINLTRLRMQSILQLS